VDSVKNKNIWIIGASSGIGEALARELAAQGAKITISARSEDKLKAIADSLGEGHTALPLDASNPDMLINAANSFKDLDTVIFLAAIYAPHSKETKDIDFIHKMLDVNIGGVFNTVNAVQPVFEKQGKGQLILCGSVAGYRGLPYGQPYCATKAAIHNYAESLKIELEPKNIDVKVISPGFVKTQLTDKNEFPMPMIIETDEAAKAIAKGITGNQFEIHFPKKFTYIMKLIKILPTPLFFALSRKMRKAQ